METQQETQEYGDGRMFQLGQFEEWVNEQRDNYELTSYVIGVLEKYVKTSRRELETPTTPQP